MSIHSNERGASGATGATLAAEANADWASAVRQGLWLLALGFGGFLLWATLAPIDEGIPTQGVLGVDSKRKRIDHLAGGLVERILVREGQRVAAGEELVVLNEAQSKATLNATRSQWRTAVATAARLDAERKGLAAVVFPPALTGESADGEVASVMRSQSELFRSRRTALDGELRIIREAARGLEGQLASLAQLKTGREKQIEIFDTQQASFQKLSQRGFVSKNQLLDLERQLAEIRSKQGEDLANIGGINSRLAELRMRDNQRQFDYRRDVEAQLADVEKEVGVLAERLASQRDAHARLSVRSPVAGTVVDLAVNTIGGVIKPGDRILDIVPDGDSLVVEAQVSPQYVDRLRAGLPADVHFDGYVSMAARPLLRGTVSVVSADALTDARNGVSYYAMRVAVPVEEVKKLANVRLQPGMQATVMVKTGERTLLTYLMRPLFRRFDSALREY